MSFKVWMAFTIIIEAAEKRCKKSRNTKALKENKTVKQNLKMIKGNKEIEKKNKEICKKKYLQ